MQIKTTMWYTSHPTGWLLSKKEKKTRIGENVEKLVFCTTGRNKMAQLLWKTLWQFLKRLKLELLYDPAIPLLGIYPKELKAGPQRDICTPVFKAALFTIAKKWKQPKCPSVDEQISKTWSIHMMEYSSALKSKEILTPAIIWVNIEDIMLMK